MRLDTERYGNFFQAVERQVAGLPLHMSYERTVESGLKSEMLLGPAPFMPELQQILRKNSSDCLPIG